MQAPWACLLEPLCVAVHAADSISGRHSDLIILGAGTVGLLIAQLARARGMRVSLVDPQEGRRKLKDHLGFYTDSQLNKLVTSGVLDGPVSLVDATGSASAFVQILEYSPLGSEIVIVGYSSDEAVSIQPATIMLKQLSIKGVLSGLGFLPQAIQEVVSKNVTLAPMVTHQFSFDDYEQAISAMSLQDAMRVVLTH